MAGLSATKPKNQTRSAAESLLNFENPGVLLFRGKKFAVNLLWLTTDESGINFDGKNSIIKSRMALINPDFVGDRSVVISQQGYGHLKKGHRLGMPVAAASAADLLVGEWHGCFKADNGWWYVAVHGDALAPDGDKFFKSEEDAYNHFTAAMGRQHWPRAYAPEEWAVAGTTYEITLDKLLGGLVTTYLKPLNLDALFGNAQNKFLFAIAALFLMIMILAFTSTGVGAYSNPVPTLNKPVSFPIASTLVLPPRYVANPFADNTLLLEIDDFAAPQLIRRCLSTFENLYASLPGWSQSVISCKDGNVTGTWTRQNARLADLNKLRQNFNRDVTMTYDGQAELVVTQGLDLSDIEKNKMQVLRKELLFSVLTGRLESMGVLEIAQVEQQTVQSIDPTTGLTVSTPSPERYMSVVFKSPLSAYLWAENFDIPGFKPLELTWSIKDSQWTLTGLVQFQ